MRIIAGDRRRMRLVSVPGLTVRPASDRLRESVFNILADQVSGARVLDLFAGIGSIGLEALSRGAASAEFVERDRRVFGALVENIERLDFADRSARHAADVFRWTRRQPDEARWDLVFVDPPYALYRQDGPRAQLDELFARAADRLRQGGTMIASAPTDRPAPEPPPTLVARRSRKYGQTWILLWDRRQDVPPSD